MFTKIDCTVRMRSRVLMTGKKDTKTGLWMLPLSMDESTISPAAPSMISQVASDVLQPITAASHQQLQDKPNLHASASSASENNVFSHATQNTHWCFYRQKSRSEDGMQELIYNLTPTTNMEELAKYHHQSVCSPPKSSFLRAISNRQFMSFPGLTYQLISKHLPPSTAMDKGHIIRQRSGVQSTRHNPSKHT